MWYIDDQHAWEFPLKKKKKHCSFNNSFKNFMNSHTRCIFNKVDMTPLILQ